jgi:hypothetical protein
MGGDLVTTLSSELEKLIENKPANFPQFKKFIVFFKDLRNK